MNVGIPAIEPLNLQRLPHAFAVRRITEHETAGRVVVGTGAPDVLAIDPDLVGDADHRELWRLEYLHDGALL